MSNTIFKDDFPLITTSEELQQLFLKYPEYDEYYIASWSIQDRKAFFSEMWKDFKPYADPEFLSELKQKWKFHQRSWEMYIWSILIKKWLVLQIKNNSEWPDIILNNNIYIECIATEHWSGENAVQLVIYNTLKEKTQIQNFPSEQILMRITNAIEKKLKQYKQWAKTKQRFNKKNWYIIAINSGKLWHLQEYSYDVSVIMQALFGVHNIQFDQKWNRSLSFRNHIFNKNNQPINVDCFCTGKYKEISWIIFSWDFILNLKDNNKSVFINNPFAINPIPENLFNNMDQWKATKNADWSLDIQYIPIM